MAEHETSLLPAALATLALTRQWLSPRERTVLLALVQGHTTQEIAQTLYLSPKTIESYYGQLRRKCGLQSMHPLIVFAVHYTLAHPVNAPCGAGCQPVAGVV